MMVVSCSCMDGGVWMHACWDFWGFTRRRLRWTLGSIVTKLTLVSVMLWVQLSPHKCTPSRQRSLGDKSLWGYVHHHESHEGVPSKKDRLLSSPTLWLISWHLLQGSLDLLFLAFHSGAHAGNPAFQFPNP